MKNNMLQANMRHYKTEAILLIKLELSISNKFSSYD